MKLSSIDMKSAPSHASSNVFRKGITIFSTSIILTVFYNLRRNIVGTHKIATSTESSKILGNERKTISRALSTNNLSSENSQRGSFYPWVNDYIDFHKISIKDGKLKADVPYVVYKCSDKETCGDVSDQVLSIVKAFYFAMRTGRILLIDSQFPAELKNYLNPNFVQWDVEFPPTNESIDVMNAEIPFDRSDGILGYLIGRCNGHGRHSLSSILNDPYMQGLFQTIGHPHGKDFSIPIAFHQAFETLFKFDSTVLSRAEEMKQNAGLVVPQHKIIPPIQDNIHQEMMPYIGLHNDHKNASFSVVNSTWSYESDSIDLIKCYQTFQSHFPDKYQLAYLVSDDNNIKKFMKKKDATIHYPPVLSNVDVDSTKKGLISNKSSSDFEQDVMDTWAEIAVLVDSDCLIMSSSLLSFLAYYIRGATMCNVHIPECNATTVAQRINKYTIDPISIIYPPDLYPPHNHIHDDDELHPDCPRARGKNKSPRARGENKSDQCWNTRVKFLKLSSSHVDADGNFISSWKSCDWIQAGGLDRINEYCSKAKEFRKNGRRHVCRQCCIICKECTTCSKCPTEDIVGSQMQKWKKSDYTLIVQAFLKNNSELKILQK